MGIWPNPGQYPTVGNIGPSVGGISNVLQAADANLTRPNNTTAYSSGEAIGSSTSTLFSFSNFFRANGSTALLTGLRLVASGAGISTTNMGTVTGHLFNAPPAAAVESVQGALIDQATFNVMFADDAAKLGTVSFASWTSGGGGSDTVESYAVPILSPLPICAALASQSLYLVLVAAAAFTPLASQIIKPYASAVLD